METDYTFFNKNNDTCNKYKGPEKNKDIFMGDWKQKDMGNTELFRY